MRFIESRSIINLAALDDVPAGPIATLGPFFVSFSSLAQGCKTYEEYIDTMAAPATADLNSVGVGLYGLRKPVNKLVEALPLFR